MEPSKVLILFTFFAFPFLPTKAQHSSFNAGIIAGANFSELEGEGITDYFGLNAGLIGTAKISKQSQIGIELLFSQNGEYILPEYYPPINFGQIWLNHIEIPIHFDWLIGTAKRKQYYNWNLNFGIAYTRLIAFTARNFEGKEVTKEIIYRNKEAYLFQTGIIYHFTKKLALNLKASLPIRIDRLSWTLGARMIYMIK